MTKLGTAFLTATLCVAGCAPDAYTIPAHWTGSTHRVEPVVEDFSFEAMSFGSPNDGWIVGRRFLLHLHEDQLARTFVRPRHALLTTVDFLSPDDGWAGGFRMADSETREIAIWRYMHGDWSEMKLNLPGLGDCGVQSIRFASPRQGWAVSLCTRNGVGVSIVLRYDGEAWRVDSPPGGGNWILIDLCVDDSGQGWAVGRRSAGDELGKPLIARVTEGSWYLADLPMADVSQGALNRLLCLPDGKALASGFSGTIFEGEPILFAYDGSWKQIEVPERFRSKRIAAIGGWSLEDYWLSLYEPAATALLAHVVDGEWIEVPGPLVPHGGFQGYSINAIEFVSETEAWAIANDVDGPGLFRGLVFHYKDGVWRNRNWNWHFWDERWFGLLGR